MSIVWWILTAPLWIFIVLLVLAMILLCWSTLTVLREPRDYSMTGEGEPTDLIRPGL